MERSPLATQTAILIGAVGQLGRAFAAELVEDGGWRLILTDTVSSSDSKQRIQSKLPSDSHVERRILDVANHAACLQLIDNIQSSHSSIDLLINCAGIGAGGELDQFSAGDFRRVMDVNYFGTLHACQAVIPLMKEQGSGHIVNVASITGLLAPPAMAAYASSKAAVVSLTESLYAELKPHGIGVTLCAPGFFPSPLIERGLFSDEKTRERGLRHSQSAKLTAEQVAKETLRAVRKKRLYAIMGRRARWYWRAKRLAPQWLADKLSERYHRGE